MHLHIRPVALTGYVGWCGGAGSRLGEDVEVDRPSKNVDTASYSPPIDIQSRKWVISTVPEISGGVASVQVLTYWSGNHHMAAGGHKWTRGDQGAFV